jgi:type II secretory pathway pseudopilin PulG
MLIVIAVLGTVLLHRLAEVSQEARRVQLRMAAENARINAQLIALRCSEGLDLPCWQRVLSDLKRANLRTPQGPTTADPDTHVLQTADVPTLLQTIALAAGLRQDAAVGRGWRLLPDGTDTLHVSLEGVSQCRFSLHWQGPKAPVRVQDVEDLC